MSEGGRTRDPGSNDAPRSSRLYLHPVAARNPFEEALVQLARAIRLGAIPVGGKFPAERELGEMLGVSRSTLREAIRGLEQAGYITTRRGRSGGTFVVRNEATLPGQDRKRALGPQMVETLDFRAAIEPGAAELAAAKVSGETVEELRSFLAEMEEETDSAEFVRKNCQLHIQLAEATACLPLVRAVSTVELGVMDALLAMPNIEPTETRSHAHHRKIVDAIAAGDAETARATMQSHLAATDTLLREFALAKRS